MAREGGGLDLTPRPWSDDDTATLVRLWPGHGNDVIAKHLGRSAGSIAVKASRLGLPPRSPDGSGTIRRCLASGCGRYFLSKGPHNRICEPCKASEEWADGTDRAEFPLRFFLSDP